MKLSVAMMTYNHGAFIEHAIKSVLSQKDKVWAGIVVANLDSQFLEGIEH
jgi:glycosyltransferase involved in cell wall biosynthesis